MIMKLLKSRAIQGALMVILANVFAVTQIPIDVEDVSILVPQAFSLVGAIWAIWGRMHASGPLI